jgi:hypothetical protein
MLAPLLRLRDLAFLRPTMLMARPFISGLAVSLAVTSAISMAERWCAIMLSMNTYLENNGKMRGAFDIV